MSRAYEEFLKGVSEVSDLSESWQKNPLSKQNSSLMRTESSKYFRVIGRAQTVLLCAHFERYIYSINEDASEFLNKNFDVCRDRLPDVIRLAHSRKPIELIFETSWERRSDQLRSFIDTDGWLWNNFLSGRISHERLTDWIKSPKPEQIRRFYRQWGIDDIFKAICRSPTSRSRLWLSISAFVDARNNIAHGDYETSPTMLDVKRYINSAKEFVSRSDRALARQLSKLFRSGAPW